MMFKICPSCKQKKVIEDFARNTARRDGRQVHCRACKAYYDHNYYLINKKIHYENVKKYLAENRQRVWDYLQQHPCIDCGEKDPIVLDFDHFEAKKAMISYMKRNRFSWKSIKNEIKKCVVRCANCHRKKTAQQFGWYQSIGIKL